MWKSNVIKKKKKISYHFPCWPVAVKSCYMWCASFIIAQSLNTLRPRQNGRHFADDTFKRIPMNENVRVSTNISLKFVPEGLINNIPALVQIMAWRRPGAKPLSEPMMFNLLTHICVTRPQWVKTLQQKRSQVRNISNNKKYMFYF